MPIAIANCLIAPAFRSQDTPSSTLEKLLTTLAVLFTTFFTAPADFARILPVPLRTSPTPPSMSPTPFKKLINLYSEAIVPVLIIPVSIEPQSTLPTMPRMLSTNPPIASHTPGNASVRPTSKPATIKPPIAINTLEGDSIPSTFLTISMSFTMTLEIVLHILLAPF